MAPCGADSALFKDIFGAEKMREIFSDEMLVQRWLDVEAALAEAEAELGLIPMGAASEIRRKANLDFIDLSALKKGIDVTGHPIVPLIRLLERACEGDSGKYIHWGATTQDIMDSAVVLQIRDAYEVILGQLSSLDQIMCELARKYRDTVMAGRTHGQHALPVTFGFKVAVWVEEMRRHMQRLEESKKRVLVGQFAGAAGTLASLGENAERVQKLLMHKLGLGVSKIAWHNSRDGIAEFVLILAMIAATAGKIANEVVALQKTEVAELEEPFSLGNTVGSSTMPHKRNPMMSEGLIATAHMVKFTALAAIDGMGHEHERDMRRWAMEWDFIPRVCIMTSGVLDRLSFVLKGLVVKPERMMQNLMLLKGLINSEEVMLEIAKFIGRQEAHEVIYEDSMKVYEEDKPFRTVLLEDPRVSNHLDEETITRLLDPRSYTGLAGRSVDKVVGEKE
ncbi:MAG TPA: adenylosuccinate lyase [Firmicutes bacterium]|nr:adenylosuccinate lyase [Bacillota bacterium]